MQLRGHQIGQYRILNLLKKGGMGEIYLAEEEQLRRQVAIKIIWTDVSHYDDPQKAREAIRLFLREAQTLAQFDHQHILPIFSSGESDFQGVSFMYLVMPYRSEGSLSDWLQRNNYFERISIWDVDHILQQAADALQHAHDLNIIHQDVKSSNFLVHGKAQFLSQLTLQLADFGIARFMTTTSKSQEVRGTPLYMAPEQWDNHPLPATDQYALAIMVYELLTGQSPFPGTNRNQLWHQHFHTQPPPPSTINHSLPQNLDAIILKALAKAPEDRFASVTTFGDTFRQAILYSNHSPTLRTRSLVAEAISPPHPVPPLERTVPVHYRPPSPPSDPPRRHWGIKFLLLSLVLILLVTSGGLLYMTRAYQQGVISGLTATAMSQSAAHNLTVSGNQTETTNANANAATTVSAQETSTANTTSANATATQASLMQTAVAKTATVTRINADNATATTWAGITTGSGTLIFDDSLQSPNAKSNWDVSVSGHSDNSCSFSNSQYHASVNQTQDSIQPCFAQSTDFTNCTYQVMMTIISGSQGGMVLHGNETNGTFYYFYIDTNGSFGLALYNHDVFQTTLTTNYSAAIYKGLGQANLLTAGIVNNTFSLYVNKTLLTTFPDNQSDQSIFGHGQIGVAAEAIGGQTDVAFTNAQVWQK